MPFGTKPDPTGGPDIDFDRIYGSAIKPGIEDAAMQPIRADEEKLGGIIHKAMFERLLVCGYALADLTTSNANVLYELGVRHTARPGTTLTLYARSTPLPFDVRLLRTVPYDLAAGNAFDDASASQLRSSVASGLDALRTENERKAVCDSPLYELVPAWNPPPLEENAASSLREDVRATEELKANLGMLRALGREEGQRDTVRSALVALRERLLVDGIPDAGVLVTMMLVHRSIADWDGMIDVCAAMPAEVARQVPIRQQRAFAHNRISEAAMSADDVKTAALERSRALSLLAELEIERGPTSETSGLIGRIYKSQWLRARTRGETVRAAQFLAKAVDAYLRGFATDWREVYPGINAVTLLEARGDDEACEQRDRLLPVVRFAVEQRLRMAEPEYWDHASLLEIQVLVGDPVSSASVLPTVRPTT
jgi:hypothetical protein